MNPRDELRSAIREDLTRNRVVAASGNPGCKAARARMPRLMADLLRLELERPVR